MRTYLKIPKELIKGKFVPRSEPFMFIGYTLCGYKLFDRKTNDIVEGVNVIFNESQLLSKLRSQTVDNLSNVINPSKVNARSNLNQHVIDLDNIENIIKNEEETNENFASKNERNVSDGNYNCVYNVMSYAHWNIISHER